MNPSLTIAITGLIYILGFGALSYMRRQGVSLRFAVESLIVTAVGAVLPILSVSVHLVLFLVVLYLVTMRVRLLADLGNLFTSRKRYPRALTAYRFALGAAPDVSSRQIVLINRGVTELRMGEPETARRTLEEALAGGEARPGAKYLAACYYNLGLACLRAGDEAAAVLHFNEAIDTLPSSIYAHGARQALKRRQSGEE